MFRLKRTLGVFVAALVALAVVGVASPARADGPVQIIGVSGTFQTISLDCAVLTNDECVTDGLAGGLVGTDELGTNFINEGPNFWAYEDDTLATTQYGVFRGLEHGVIDVRPGPTRGDFKSVRVATSTDGCGSKLIVSFEGNINLDAPEELTDSGTYEGQIILKEC